MNRKTSHPGEEFLLQYADGELPSREAASVRVHLQACWRCRAEVEDLQQTITEYVRYEQAVSGTPPDPPSPWDGFEHRLDRLIAERHNFPLPRTFIPVLSNLLRNRRIIIAALTAAALVCFAVFELRHPPSVSAAELLQRASEREGRTAHRPRLRIKTRGRTFTRTAVARTGSGPDSEAEAEIQSFFIAANYNWQNPLSAASFAAWRSQLSDRHDDVALQGTHETTVYQVRTRTRSNSLEEAILNLRANDLDVVSGAFHFRNSEWVEVAAVPDVPKPLPEQPSEEPRHPPHSVAPAPGGQISLDLKAPAQELRVIAALHSAKADLGDQVELSRSDGGRLIVTATAIAPDRRVVLETSLSHVPGISLRFLEPKIDRSDTLEPQSSQSRVPTPSNADPFQRRLQESLGGVAGVARFTDHVLEASEAAIVQVHDLRRLAVLFPPEVEDGFGVNDRATLAQLRRDYVRALSTKSAELHGVLAPVFVSLGAPESSAVPQPSSSPNWQAATETLFMAAQRLDHLLTRLLTGDGVERPSGIVLETDLALKQLQVDIDWYQSMNRENERRY